ncbi:MAG TPA: Fic family protein [Candidatus Faecimonas gallistercoris]|nr:Fic family protein [Candidatus Faecimonas gallistercoris]
MKNIKSRIDESLDSQSKYCYPNTEVLINKLGIKDQETLEVAERRITTLMLSAIQLRDIPSPSKLFSGKYYLDLHKEVFEHIYDFAGQIRDENITKGNTPFCRPEFIYSYLNETLQTLGKKITKIQSKDDITTWLADCYGELNIIHPFREGNGRIAREFLRESVECMDKYLGFNYELAFSDVNEQSSEQFIHASIVSAITGDNQELKSFFTETLKEKSETKVNQEKKGK